MNSGIYWTAGFGPYSAIPLLEQIISTVICILVNTITAPTNTEKTHIKCRQYICVILLSGSYCQLLRDRSSPKEVGGSLLAFVSEWMDEWIDRWMNCCEINNTDLIPSIGQPPTPHFEQKIYFFAKH